MRSIRIIEAFTLALFVLLSLTNIHGQEEMPGRASLAKVEGVVSSVETIPSEAGGRLMVARIKVDESEPRELSIVLAPEDTLRQIGFEVQVGDRLRARIFLSASAPGLAHKVMNMTRGTMVRLRTLTRIPLWNGQGQWQGGPCRARRGGPSHGGRRH